MGDKQLETKKTQDELRLLKCSESEQLDAELALLMDAMEANYRTALEPSTKNLYLTEWAEIVKDRGIGALQRVLTHCLRNPDQKFFPNLNEVHAALLIPVSPPPSVPYDQQLLCPDCGNSGWVEVLGSKDRRVKRCSHPKGLQKFEQIKMEEGKEIMDRFNAELAKKKAMNVKPAGKGAAANDK